MRPSYNHTREDGPFDPCPECFRLMSRDELFSYASGLRDDVADLKEAAGEPSTPFVEYILATYDVKLVGSDAEVFRYRRDVINLREAAANVVAQQRGDLSRKPFIGRLRDALAALGA